MVPVIIFPKHPSPLLIDLTSAPPSLNKVPMAPAASQILSDLHLEAHHNYNYELKQTAPYLALLGDIGHVADDAFLKFRERQLRRYRAVLLVLGNHEPSHISFPAAKAHMQAFAQRMEALRVKSTIGRFALLDQTRYDVNETLTVLGCTLFSDILPDQAAAIGGRFVDFRDIREWTVENHIDAHWSDVKWLNETVARIAKEEPQRQVAIFTHHCPTIDERVVEPQYRGKTSEVSSGFMTDLSSEECWRNAAVVMWAFGHTHYCCEFVDEHGKAIIANQKGYYGRQALAFDMKRVYFIGKENASA